MPIPFAAFIPAIAGAAQNILSGINNRKTRLYNSPVQQVKRLREAGLPLSAGSNITAGGGVSTPVNSFGFEQFNDNIGKGTLRQIDRKKLEITQQELISATAKAALDEGNAQNQLNPAGIFANTNQGTGINQTLATQKEAIKTAETVNQFMPMEKAMDIMKSGKDIELLSSQITNNLLQYDINVKDYEIKSILARYQERMSQQQLNALIKDNAMRNLRNVGMGYDNSLKRISSEIALATQGYQIELARNAAINSGQSVLANKLAYTRDLISLPSFRKYYEIRKPLDNWVSSQPRNLATTLLYMGMMSPTQSTYNFNQLMPSIPSSGNTYNTNNYIPKQN